MNLKLKSINVFSTLEIAVVVLFVVFILFPVQPPRWTNGPVGYLLMAAAAIYLFTQMNPILGVLFLFVVYESIRRTSMYGFGTLLPDPVSPYSAHKQDSVQEARTLEYAPVEQMQEHLSQHNDSTLEEEIVNARAPVGQGVPTQRTEEGSFLPVSSKVSGASMYA